MVRRRYGDEMLVEAVQHRLLGHLLHVTDERNLETIEKHGLLSVNRAKEIGVTPSYPGGSQLTRALDGNVGLDHAVFLSFFNLGLMPKYADAKQRRPVLLRIDPGILFLSGVRVALGRANRSRTNVYKPARAFYEMDWELIFGDVDMSQAEGKLRYLQVRDYEVLVPNTVPTEYILGLA
jgi:hypothetical protein